MLSLSGSVKMPNVFFEGYDSSGVQFCRYYNYFPRYDVFGSDQTSR